MKKDLIQKWCLFTFHLRKTSLISIHFVLRYGDQSRLYRANRINKLLGNYMNWKKLFQKHILERGYDYFLEGAVTQLKTCKNEISAVVEGTYDYDVSIFFNNGIVSEMFCNCPYAEGGSNCKHMAAVLYESEEQSENSPCNSFNEIESLLEKASPETVKKFLAEALFNDSKLLLKFKAQCDYSNDNFDLRGYKREIDRAINCYSDCGYISYQYADDFIYEMESYLYDDVEKLIDRKQYKAAFDLSCLIFLKISEIDMDDSNGGLSEFGCVCLDKWNKIIELADTPIKDAIFSWLINHLDGSLVDYMEGYIESALMQNFREKKYLERKLEFTGFRLDRVDEQDIWYANYLKEHWAMLHINVMEQLNYGDDKIFEYCKGLWELSDVRDYCIDKKIKSGDYSAAIDILNESMELDIEYGGLIDKYRHKLKDVYKQIGDTQNYKKQLWHIVIESNQVNIEEYRELKAMFDRQEWLRVREEIFSSVSDNTAAPLYCEEHLYDRLLKYVLTQYGISALMHYESDLASQYPKQVLEKYEEFLQSSARNSSTRKTYKEWVDLLRRMKKIYGGEECVNKIISSWRSMYGNRPAMMQELDKL